MKKIQLAVVGLGNMGRSHCQSILSMEHAELTAVCDANAELVTRCAKEYKCQKYRSVEELFTGCDIDGLVIATPHYDHTTIAIKAFGHGLHVLTEKPVGVHVRDVQSMISAWEKAKKGNAGLAFAAMFQQRTSSAAAKIKDLLEKQELGRLIRTTWIITDWYRTQSYYDSGQWRATWSGEGGGVLMNQCPHQLDMFQWFVGRPDRVMGFASLGKYHNIEVEDEVTAYFEYDNGMVGHFITTTGESPGSNRLEIVGEYGKLIWEGNTLTFFRNRESLLEHLQNAQDGFGRPEHWVCDIPLPAETGGYKTMLENFCETIRGRATLIAPATEGLHSIEMDNAIMLSSFEKRMISLPIDGDMYAEKLQTLIEGSKHTKEQP